MDRIINAAERVCVVFAALVGMYAAAEAVHHFVGGWLSYAWAGAVVFLCLSKLRDAPATPDSEDRKEGA